LKCQSILGIAGSFEEIEQTLSLAFGTKRQVSAAVPAEHPVYLMANLVVIEDEWT